MVKMFQAHISAAITYLILLSSEVRNYIPYGDLTDVSLVLVYLTYPESR